jgi:hypothetical protein
MDVIQDLREKLDVGHRTLKVQLARASDLRREDQKTLSLLASIAVQLITIELMIDAFEEALAGGRAMLELGASLGIDLGFYSDNPDEATIAAQITDSLGVMEKGLSTLTWLLGD